MKRVFIIHGYDATPSDNWFPWLKKQLEEGGFSVTAPQMPDTGAPTLEKWLLHIQQIVGTCDEDTFFVGHSLGTITCLRFLEALPENEKAGGVVLVAGFSEDINFSPLYSFTEKPLNYEKVKKSVNKIIAIHSTDDMAVPYRFAEIIQDKLNAKLITLQGLGHINASNECFELPEALNAILHFND
ncbi:MAG: alpha/beta hydrolase [bacterium]|nr:alpha/beta hydrolase [bacterium]